jgi:dTDP-4-dehydrorhamnose 3,5-epimerase
MKLIAQPLPDINIFKPFVFEDTRGTFVKPYHEICLNSHGINMTLREEFFSISGAGVLRGMHFQIPPHAHQKIVYCIAGRVLDVVLDLRRDSPTFMRYASFELSVQNRHVVHIPTGYAHGFLSLEDNSCLIYKTDVVNFPQSDRGLLWNSFGFKWPINEFEAIISQRDLAHPPVAELSNPF